MTPQEKAKELVNEKYYQPITLHLSVSNNSQQMWDYAKMCAIVCCDEVLAFSKSHNFSIREDNDYWRSVKEEIEKL